MTDLFTNDDKSRKPLAASLELQVVCLGQDYLTEPNTLQAIWNSEIAFYVCQPNPIGPSVYCYLDINE